jgi:ribosomal protein S19E (S16A)
LQLEKVGILEKKADRRHISELGQKDLDTIASTAVLTA